ncbi:MAG: hypothetical protein FWE97_01285 [Dehalococcoidia bacterium]|nr:hypothetical protein [Dehalococcoidia bacterium]
MRKKLVTLALAITLALSLVACGGGNGSGGGDRFEYGNGADYIANNLKGDYSITYRYSISGADSLELTCIRTSDGYYYDYGGSGVLYIKSGAKYDTYYGSADGGFIKVDFIEPMTEDQVKAQFIFIGWMSHYGSYASDMVKDGSETVAGRSCDRYKYTWSYFGSSVKYTYCIDKATGVCLKYAYDVASGGQSGSLTFECIEFKTNGVKLPAYN